MGNEDGPTVIRYYENGNKKEECWYRNGQLHREGGPARIRYYRNGQIEIIEWYAEGKLHNCHYDPAVVEYEPDGTIRYRCYCTEGKIIRESIYMRTNPKSDWKIRIDKRYYRDGHLYMEEWYLVKFRQNQEEITVPHRDNGPALKYLNSKKWSEIWYKDGKIHRDGHPAVIEYYSDGEIKTEAWYKDGELHRKDGPAVVEYYRNGQKYIEEWYVNGKRHRENGPALIKYNQDGGEIKAEYYINNKEVTEKDLSVYQKIKEQLDKGKGTKKILL